MTALLLTCRQTTDFLTDFLEGALPLPRSLQVRAHLSLCPSCRAFLESLRQVPARLKRLAPPAPPPRASLEGLLKGAMARIVAGEDPDLHHPDADCFRRPHLTPLLAAHTARCATCAAAHPEIPPARPAAGDPLGPALRAQLPPESQWKRHRLGLGGARIATLREDAGGTLFLLELPPGARFPHHSHRGLECAVLLQGVLDDGGERLAEGSLRTYAAGDEHAPVAKDEPCLVLVHVEDRIAFSGWRRIFN